MIELASIARQLVDESLREAVKQNLPVAVCVVDTGGHLVMHHRMSGVSYMANDVVRRKAVTACNFRLPTHIFYSILQQQPALAFAITSQPDVLAVAGGMPIIVDGTCIGGFGVGGGNFEQDQAFAEKVMQLLAG
ncbi:heme-binding protein [uncultured Fibrella sp.]|uniref:GlcG/HbpS family heme-binding protein n=1 Tax=uncultured Fibrella sp. TaxID=1284596 RepID=UPI0035CA8E59